MKEAVRETVQLLIIANERPQHDERVSRTTHARLTCAPTISPNIHHYIFYDDRLLRRQRQHENKRR